MCGSAILLLMTLALLENVECFKPSVYPAYCSESGSDQEINSAARQIPALSVSERDLVDQLMQVQVMIRHGARTPYDALQCWKDYAVRWDDCNVTQLVLPSDKDSGTVPDAPWLFRKLYDASPDKLHGDCYTGQLIQEGYYQENELGKQFKERYVGPGNSTNGMHTLLETSVWEEMDKSRFYFRSTDLQRTLMSGQQFCYNFFEVTDETIVDWHTGDSSLDPLAPSYGSCPYLEQIDNEAYADPDFIAANASQSAALSDALDAELGAGYWRWSSITDCFMTAVCTERDVPDSAGYMNDSLFNAAVEQGQFSYFHKMGYNNSEWPKLGMSDTLYKVLTLTPTLILDLILVLTPTHPKVRTNAEEAILRGSEENYKKLVLLSAHDTSVIPYVDALLGSNGPMDWWAPYASYVTLELYNATDGRHWFRAIYNGEPLQLEGCPAITGDSTGLCDAAIVLEQTLGYAEENGGDRCQQPVTSTSGGDVDDNQKDRTDGGSDDSLGISPGGLVGIILLSILVGAIGANQIVKSDFFHSWCSSRGTAYDASGAGTPDGEPETNPLRYADHSSGRRSEL